MMAELGENAPIAPIIISFPMFSNIVFPLPTVFGSLIGNLQKIYYNMGSKILFLYPIECCQYIIFIIFHIEKGVGVWSLNYFIFTGVVSKPYGRLLILH